MEEPQPEGCVPEDEFDGPPYYTYLGPMVRDGLWQGVDINTCYAASSEDTPWTAQAVFDGSLQDWPLFRELGEHRPTSLLAFLEQECPGASLDDLSDCLHAMVRYRDAESGHEFMGVQLTKDAPVFPERPGDLFYKLDADGGYPLVAVQQYVGNSMEVCPESHPVFLQACDSSQERKVWFVWTGVDPSKWELDEWIHDRMTYFDDSGGVWYREDSGQ